MNPIYQSLKSVGIYTGLCISLFLIISCSQEDDMFGTKEPFYTYSGDPIPVSPSRASIEYFDGGALTRSGETKVKSAYREPLDDDYDIITEVESVPEREQPQTRGNLGNAIRFRIVAYKNNTVNTTNYVAQADYYINDDSGSPALVSGSSTMKLQKGAYKFVCYSYNTNVALDPFKGSGTTTIPVAHGQDFLVCVLNNVNVTPDANAQCTLPAINFSRLCSQIQIVAISGNLGNITSCSATMSGLSPNQNYTMGGIDLPTTGTGGTASISWPSVNNTTANSNLQRILPNNSRTVTIQMTFTAGSPYSNKSFTIANRAFEKGKNYKITVNIVKNSVSVSGLNFKVALGNVMRVGSAPPYTYKFQTTQGDYSYSWNGGDYFNWGATDPTNVSVNNGTFTTDVCKEIGSIWRTPSQSEMNQFVTCSRTWGTYSGTNRGEVNGYYFGTTSVPSSDKKDSYVFLPAAGRRGYGVTNVYNDGTAGYYWSSTSNVSNAYNLVFSSFCNISSNNHTGGFCVRCIAEK